MSGPVLYICRAYSTNLKREDRLLWSIINPISAGREATEDDFIVLQMEASMETN